MSSNRGWDCYTNCIRTVLYEESVPNIEYVTLWFSSATGSSLSSIIIQYWSPHEISLVWDQAISPLQITVFFQSSWRQSSSMSRHNRWCHQRIWRHSLRRHQIVSLRCLSLQHLVVKGFENVMFSSTTFKGWYWMINKISPSCILISNISTLVDKRTLIDSCWYIWYTRVRFSICHKHWPGISVTDSVDNSQ